MGINKLVIIGGVAGGASCAARARRLSEDAEIVLFERGPYVSFANCGLPYYVGNVIADEQDLLVASPELFVDRFNIDVRIESLVESIDRDSRQVVVKNLKTQERYRETYDALVISPGSAPIRPNLPGIDLPGIFTLRTIPDTQRIVERVRGGNVRTAAVVGGGFIGLEMTENLHRLGISVDLIEAQPHVMPAIDPEVASFIHAHLAEKGVRLWLSSAVTRFEAVERGLSIRLASGRTIDADMVLLAVGVRPEAGLAAGAGLAVGETGGIFVNDRMQTSDPRIFAVGDAVENTDAVTGLPCLIPLAGPANRQGRIAADALFGDHFDHRFRGVQGTAVVGVMGLTVASTGLSEKVLKQRHPGIAFDKIYVHPESHAGYYPDAKTITLKVLFDKTDGRVLGAQAVGEKGVEKRIDVISTAIQFSGTVFDLEEAELCYAPQYGSAKDPVNMAGMVASNAMRGLSPVAHWEEVTEQDFVLDVRDPEEFEQGQVAGAVHIPLHELRKRLGELPKDRPIKTHCYVGQRSHIAVRILRQEGFDAYNLSGGYRLYEAWRRLKSG
ncbi:MAG: FAD-dependent oxidoreductase [Desulfobacterales bacterium]|jgi:NADPH-dependent 2,4-dienoyl-CoA reductase/sulfur reductase-like enzyme/rhodanese-related sulfurtransferase